MEALDPARLAGELDARGYAVVPAMLDAARCAELAAAYADDDAFRSTVTMERHGYGRGEYRYFRYPLPPFVSELRETMYAALVPAANAWAERLGTPPYPVTLPMMLDLCVDAGQCRPTALLLRYGPGDYNALHQDVYGEVAFPLQATVLLSRPGDDFAGGEFVLVENRPRRQGVPHVVPLARGDCVVFPNRLRPNAKGGRSVYRHGVAEIRSGSRVTMGVIFHDAQ